MHFLGIDYGSAHVGLAIGDSEGRLALPYDTLEGLRDEELLQAIKKNIDEENVEGVVVGVPKGGTEHEAQAVITRQFIAFLEKNLLIPIYTVDESFTSLEAQARLREVGDKGSDHAVAAMLILQTYFDRLP